MRRKSRSVETSTAIVCTAVLNRKWLPLSILTSRLASVALASVGGGGGGGVGAIPMISHRVVVVGWSRNVPTDKVVYLRDGSAQGPYAPQGSTSLLPKLSVTSKVSARTSYASVGSRVHFRSTEDETLLEFTSPVEREYMHRRRKFH